MVFNPLPFPGLFVDLSFVMMALALLLYARVLGGLLEVARRPPLDSMVVIAAWVLIIAFVIPDYLANALFAPNLSANADMYQYLWLCHTVSSFGLVAAAALVLYPSVSYYMWTR